MSNLKPRAERRLKARIKAYEDIRDPKEKRGMRKPGSLSGRK
jgi:hypothetical protein